LAAAIARVTATAAPSAAMSSATALAGVTLGALAAFGRSFRLGLAGLGGLVLARAIALGPGVLCVGCRIGAFATAVSPAATAATTAATFLALAGPFAALAVRSAGFADDLGIAVRGGIVGPGCIIVLCRADGGEGGVIDRLVAALGGWGRLLARRRRGHFIR
jgi:hypothetical protein